MLIIGLNIFFLQYVLNILNRVKFLFYWCWLIRKLVSDRLKDDYEIFHPNWSYHIYTEDKNFYWLGCGWYDGSRAEFHYWIWKSMFMSDIWVMLWLWCTAVGLQLPPPSQLQHCSSRCSCQLTVANLLPVTNCNYQIHYLKLKLHSHFTFMLLNRGYIPILELKMIFIS